VIDAPGPWGTGPFTLTEGYSAIYDYSIAFIHNEPFAATWLQPREERSDRVVLTANDKHWNTERGPRLQRVVYVNDISTEDALTAVCDREGEIDILGEVSPADAQRVKCSEHARLVAIDAMRVLVMIINRGPEAAPLGDVRVRRALNLGIDRDRLVSEGLGGYGTPLAGPTPPWAKGFPEGLTAYPYDPQQAKALLQQAGWPAGRPAGRCGWRRRRRSPSWRPGSLSATGRRSTSTLSSSCPPSRICRQPSGDWWRKSSRCPGTSCCTPGST